MPELYETDFYSWARQQAGVLHGAAEARLNGPAGIDWQHLALEVEALSASLERELASRYTVLLQHLLKWQFQPRRRSRSWSATIAVQRGEIARLLRKNAGIHARRGEEFDDAYVMAKRVTAAETGLRAEIFPPACPFTLEQVEDLDWLPEAPAPRDDHA